MKDTNFLFLISDYNPDTHTVQYSDNFGIQVFGFQMVTELMTNS